jgi:integrase
MGFPYGKMVQLLLLLGQRRDEVRQAVRSEIDYDNHVLMLPPIRTKNGHEHHVPLSNTSMALIENLPKVSSEAGWLFSSTGKAPVSNLKRRKQRLDALMLEELRKSDPHAQLPRWRLHDLRHTLKTWMQRARIPKDVRNAVQNHFDGDMDELYGHYSFEAKKLRALQGWTSHISGLVVERSILIHAA